MPFDPEPPVCFREERAARRIALIAESFARLVGRPLVEPKDDVVAVLWRAPVAIVAHGTEADPLFFFANRSALDAFETDLARFIGMPSRLSAEAPARGERQLLLDRVAAQGFIADYSGVRIAATGRRFRIERATVWNLVDDGGGCHGQAATFTL
jgi:hypothetical protein